MPLLYMFLAVGIFIGIWISRMQLRGKFILAEEAMEEANWRLAELEQAPQHPPASWVQQNATLSEQWGLPNYHNRPVQSCVDPLDLPLIRDDGRPQWSAKQVIGYNQWGFEHPPQYPGGLPVWDAVVNGIAPDDEEL